MKQRERERRGLNSEADPQKRVGAALEIGTLRVARKGREDRTETYVSGRLDRAGLAAPRRSCARFQPGTGGARPSGGRRAFAPPQRTGQVESGQRALRQWGGCRVQRCPCTAICGARCGINTRSLSEARLEFSVRCEVSLITFAAPELDSK